MNIGQSEGAFSTEGAFKLSDYLLSEAIRVRHDRIQRPIIVGLCGAQGSGKSTTADRIASRLKAAEISVAICAFDDFYFTRAERMNIAERVHPLFATRGVPGTHDVALLDATLDSLITAGPTDETPVPRFDKALDDRTPPAGWRCHSGRADVVLLEGWCVGALPDLEEALAEPLNALEREEDADGDWRRHANALLAGEYAALFERLDLRILLRAPSFECIHGWRAEQEAKLPRDAAGARAPMDDAALTRFIAHYERITRRLLAEEPADLVVDLNRHRVPVAWRLKTLEATFTPLD